MANALAVVRRLNDVYIGGFEFPEFQFLPQPKTGLNSPSLRKDVGLLVHPESQMSRVLPALWLASCAEKGSEHPLGQAVAKEGEKLIQEWSNGFSADVQGN